MQCPKCGSSNAILNGKNSAGNPVVKCKDCGKQTVLNKKISLSQLICKECGVIGVNSRDSILCKRCYDRNRIQDYKYKGRLRIKLTSEQKILIQQGDINWVWERLTVQQSEYFVDRQDELCKQLEKLASV